MYSKHVKNKIIIHVPIFVKIDVPIAQTVNSVIPILIFRAIFLLISLIVFMLTPPFFQKCHSTVYHGTLLIFFQNYLESLQLFLQDPFFQSILLQLLQEDHLVSRTSS